MTFEWQIFNKKVVKFGMKSCQDCQMIRQEWERQLHGINIGTNVIMQLHGINIGANVIRQNLLVHCN